VLLGKSFQFQLPVVVRYVVIKPDIKIFS